jgi:hypothetical protein
VFVGIGVHEGRKVGLLVAGTNPAFVGVIVTVGVSLGTGLEVNVFVGKGVAVAVSGRILLVPHPVTEKSKNIVIIPNHDRCFNVINNVSIVFPFYQLILSNSSSSANRWRWSS